VKSDSLSHRTTSVPVNPLAVDSIVAASHVNNAEVRVRASQPTSQSVTVSLCVLRRCPSPDHNPTHQLLKLYENRQLTGSGQEEDLRKTGYGQSKKTLYGLVSEMTYTVLSGTLNPSIPYHTFIRTVNLGMHVWMKAVVGKEWWTEYTPRRSRRKEKRNS